MIVEVCVGELTSGSNCIPDIVVYCELVFP